MAIIRITKQFKFEMAHALAGYNGPCRHIHGHSYELFVTVTGEPVDTPGVHDYGMVIDFQVLKEIVRSEIISQFDHALLLHRATAPEQFSGMGDVVGRLILVDYQPTSENMLIEFASRLQKALPEHIQLFSLRLHETVTSYAEWFASDNR